MNVLINQQPYQLPEPAKVSDAIAALGARPPYAVAVNTQFVPQARHAEHSLQEGDRIEIIAPVTGG